MSWGGGDTQLSEAELFEILSLARHAPSGDNTQPWRVRLCDGHFEVVCNAHAAESVLDDPAKNGSRVGLGAFAESMRLAASTIGIEAKIAPSADPQDAVWARITLSRGRAARTEALVNQLERRTTNRRPYAIDSFGDADETALQHTIDTVEGVGLTTVRGRDAIEALAQELATIDRVRLRNRACHEEFHRKVRWTAAQAEHWRTGFWYKTFEVRADQALALRMTRSYSTQRTLEAIFNISAIAARYSRRQIRASGAIGALVLDGERTPERMLRAGIALQRIWLRATARELWIQPLALVPLLVSSARQRPTLFDEEARRGLDAAADTVSSIIDTPFERTALLFRVGRGPAPTARSLRLDPHRLIAPPAAVEPASAGIAAATALPTSRPDNHRQPPLRFEGRR